MITSATRKDSRLPPQIRNRLHIAAVLVVAVVVMASTSCSSPYRKPELTPSESGFSGIADAFKAADGSDVPEVDVLLVHGMGYHDSTWIQTMVQPLAVALGFDSEF